jgi:DNA-directed RNA polymerase subunit omega
MINHLNMEGFPMVEPTIDELLTKAERKYSLVCAAAKRARELVDGAEPMNTGDAAKPVTMALQEIAEDKIGYVQTNEGIK